MLRKFLRAIFAFLYYIGTYVLLKGSDRLREWNSTKLARHVKIIGTYWVTGSPLWLEFLSEWGKNQFNRMNFEHPSPNYENSNFEQYSKYSVLCFNKNWDLATKNLIYLKVKNSSAKIFRPCTWWHCPRCSANPITVTPIWKW